MRAALVLLCWGLPQAAGTVAAAPDFTVSDYRLELTIDREHHRVEGRERIRLRGGTDRLAVVTFPQNGLVIRSVTGEPGGALPVRISQGQIEIRTAAPLARGQELSLVLEYWAQDPKGIVFHRDAVYSLFHTCHWMICRDRPDEKATFTLAMAVPDGSTLVASGAPVDDGAGGAPKVWKELVPSSTYLFGFALGKFSRSARRHRGTTLEYFTAGQDQAWLRRAFADDDRMLDFFVAKAGRPLPRAFYRQVVVEGDAAQELSSFSILGRDELEHRLRDPTEDWLVAHELAHQFWGNLVTCADWTHFWLNEGLTVFMVAAYKEHRWGGAAYAHELELLRARHQAAIEAKFDVPLTFAGEYPSLRLKRAVVYSKGALFLVRLRELMGERAFWAALASYTRRFAGRAATTGDLQRVFAAETDRDLSPLFGQWAYGRRP
jgi:aminopeptidase N